MKLSGVHINPDGVGLDMVILNQDGSTFIYKYPGKVDSTIRQDADGQLTLDITVAPPQGESPDRGLPPNAYKG